ncbi:MAG: hypothetical protein ACKPA7_02145, partial [Sphaerospermopsis kisseleviana]
KSALIKQARQTVSKFTQGLSPGVQESVNSFFDADQSNEEGSITNFVGKTLAGQAKKTAEKAFKTILPNTYEAVKNFIGTGVLPTKAPNPKTPQVLLGEAATELKSAANALKEAAASLKGNMEANKSKTVVAEEAAASLKSNMEVNKSKTIVAEEPRIDAKPLPKKLPVKEQKVPLQP